MPDNTLIPVSKNGKFFGYATAAQIAAKDSLEVFDEKAAQALKAKQAVDDAGASADDAATKQAVVEAGDKSADKAPNGKADPAAVKKAPNK